MKKDNSYLNWKLIVLLFLIIAFTFTAHISHEIRELSNSISELHISLQASRNDIADMQENFRKELNQMQEYFENQIVAIKFEQSKTKYYSETPSIQDTAFQSNSSLEKEDDYNSTDLADKAYKQYIYGSWDGTPTIIDEQSISLDSKGILLINGRQQKPSGFCYAHSVDTPPSLENVIPQFFILGDGTYRLENNSLVKYSKGKKVTLAGDTLDWTGMDTENYRPFDTTFYYDEAEDELFIIATSVPYDFSNKKLKDNVGIYLYSIPDRSKSEIEFISQIKYTRKGNDYIFDSSVDSNIKDFLYMEEIMEFEFDWRCTFADGFINSRDAFPEGTFTHPVTTTPRVPLSAYTG